MTGIPFYFFAKPVIGVQAASLIMVGIMLPFFFVGMYEKDGFPAEKLLYHVIRQKFLLPGIRPYKSENVYRRMEREDQIRKEVAVLEDKAIRRNNKIFHEA